MKSVAQVVAVSFAKRHLKAKEPEQPWLSMYVYMPPNSINSKLPYTNQFRCLDKAAILTPEDEMNPDGSAADPWRLCSMQQVEEVKCLMRVLPIWAAALIFHIPIVQQQTFVVFQALQSDGRLGKTSIQIPAASYSLPDAGHEHMDTNLRPPSRPIPPKAHWKRRRHHIAAKNWKRHFSLCDRHASLQKDTEGL